MVYSDEWLLLRPSRYGEYIVGDTLIVQEGTDVDTIFVQFGGSTSNNYAFGDQKKQEFQAYRILPETDPKSKYQYKLQQDQKSLTSA